MKPEMTLEEMTSIAFGSSDPQILSEIANKTSDFIVISTLALNSNTPSECYDLIVEKIADADTDGLYLSQLAYRKNTSEKTLRKLASLQIYAVDYALAQNINTPEEVLEQIAKRNNTVEIIAKLSRNFSTPLYIRQWALRIPEVSAYLYEESKKEWANFNY